MTICEDYFFVFIFVGVRGRRGREEKHDTKYKGDMDPPLNEAKMISNFDRY
jgi:hypothetical protein